MRQHLIGGTDAATLIGLGRESKLHLWMRLRGDIEDEHQDSTAMRAGKLFEEHVARPLFAEEGMALIRPDKLVYTHPDDARIGCSLDFICDATHAPAEIKLTASRAMWGPPRSREVPHHVMAQVQFQLAVMRACGETPGKAFLCVMFLPDYDPVIYEIPEDQQVGLGFITMAKDLLRMVDEGEAPDPKDEADSRSFYLARRGDVMVLTAEQLEQLKWLARAQKSERSLARDIKQIRDALVPSFGSATELVDADGNVIASYNATRRFDEAAFTQAHPDIALQFQRLDGTALRAQHKKLVEQFMSYPDDAQHQVRQLRIKLKVDDEEL